MRKIRKGDEVVVIAGKDKGKRGSVLKVLPDDRVIVENVNIVKRHTKPNPAANLPGGIIEKEAPIHVSNVMLYNPQTQKGDRVGFRILEDGRKVRYFKSTNEVVDA
ncbi:MAG: 50S ribosomal protein L24 [Gammaproteobacteria bacterium]|nr:MAG: 50S ribosomal protein L24 [Gammaproteobacteria bacterium]